MLLAIAYIVGSAWPLHKKSLKSKESWKESWKCNYSINFIQSEFSYLYTCGRDVIVWLNANWISEPHKQRSQNHSNLTNNIIPHRINKPFQFKLYEFSSKYIPTESSQTASKMNQRTKEYLLLYEFHFPYRVGLYTASKWFNTQHKADAGDCHNVL